MAYAPCAKRHGDFNHDGKVDEADLAILLSYMLQRVVPTNPEMVAADFTGDGVINIYDYTIFTQILNGHCPICDVDLAPYTGKPVSSAMGTVITLAALAVVVIILTRWYKG